MAGVIRMCGGLLAGLWRTGMSALLLAASSSASAGDAAAASAPPAAGALPGQAGMPALLPPLPPMRDGWGDRAVSGLCRSYLPLAVTGAPRLAEAARQQPLRARPTGDRPALAWQAGPVLAVRRLAPSGALAYEPSPDAARLVRPWSETGPDPARPRPTTDPAEDEARRALLAKPPETRAAPAPFLRLAIPEPLELSAAVRLGRAPPDQDAPVAVTERPPRPLLRLEQAAPAKP